MVFLASEYLENWEKSVVSIHKGSDSCNLDNCGPSSKVSRLAKLLESSIKLQLKELQTTSSILNGYQVLDHYVILALPLPW